MAQSCPPITRNLGSYCVLAHQTINTVICKTFQHHKEPSQDRWCSGRFYRKQQLGVCANSLLLSPFPRLCVTEHADTCDTEADAVSFTGYTTGCFAGDIRCGFTGDGLSEINLSVTVEARFLMGAVSPEMCSFSLLTAAGTELKFVHNTLNNLSTHYNTLKCLFTIR